MSESERPGSSSLRFTLTAALLADLARDRGASQVVVGLPQSGLELAAAPRQEVCDRFPVRAGVSSSTGSTSRSPSSPPR
jgi:hypothetical protein